MSNYVELQDKRHSFKHVSPACYYPAQFAASEELW